MVAYFPILWKFCLGIIRTFFLEPVEQTPVWQEEDALLSEWLVSEFMVFTACPSPLLRCLNHRITQGCNRELSWSLFML